MEASQSQGGISLASQKQLVHFVCTEYLALKMGVGCVLADEQPHGAALFTHLSLLLDAINF